MSYPRLVITGPIDKRAITGIAVSYDNDTLPDKPALLTRVQYDVKRAHRTSSTASGINRRDPKIIYDDFRLIHTWVGYIDCLTESVSITANSTDEDILTVYHIKTSAILNITHGPEHTIKSFVGDLTDLGPEESSLGGAYATAFEQGLTWRYGVSGENPNYVYDTSLLWVIKDINIADKGNNVSRVTFFFEIQEPWESLAGVINGLTE